MQPCPNPLSCLARDTSNRLLQVVRDSIGTPHCAIGTYIARSSMGHITISTLTSVAALRTSELLIFHRNTVYKRYYKSIKKNFSCYDLYNIIAQL